MMDMLRANQNEESNELSVLVVAFHIPQEKAPSAAAAALDKTIGKIFGDSASRVKTSDHATHEILFAIQTPVIPSDAIYRELFEQLQSLLSVTSIYTPHFTQLPSEVVKRGI